MKFFLLLLLSLLFACSSSSDLGKIDYSDEDLTVDQVMQHEATLMKEKKYKDLRDAYDWIKRKSPDYFEKNLKLKYIDLYGYEGRYERQILEYAKVFPNDSTNTVDKVPNFYFQMGKSYENRAKLTVSSAVDSTMLEKAIGYYKKCYLFSLEKKPEIQSAAQYYAALSSAKLGNYQEASRLYGRLIDTKDFKNLEYHKRAFFKRDNVQNTDDIEVSDDMSRIYTERYAIEEVRKDSLARQVDQLIKNSGMFVADTLRRKN